MTTKVPVRIAAVVLAAGQSTRMEGGNKLLLDLGGMTLIERTVGASLASSAHPVLVVVGHEQDRVRAALRHLDATIVQNPNHATGLASSIRAGITALPQGLDGALIMLGDMPHIRPDHIDRLITSFAGGGDPLALVPTFKGRRGNPVLWAAAAFPMLAALKGDIGGRALLTRHGDRVRDVTMADDGILIDLDSRDDVTVYQLPFGPANNRHRVD
ncbi:MAG: nucleotidyltransferase family protein [Rhodospirillales bacterium]|nr:nucleotidyltransferase family protein [Rhodospirillales bacterium]